MKIVRGGKGLCVQRNAIPDAAAGCGLISFFDDDFLAQLCLFDQAERLFRENSAIAVATGKVLADGIHGADLSVSQAMATLAADAGADAHPPCQTVYNAYGCNMTFRMKAILDEGALFDENLPLCAWQEDVDFCRRLLRGVHLGHKTGRISGLRLGCSQIANPLYIARKGTVSLRWP